MGKGSSFRASRSGIYVVKAGESRPSKIIGKSDGPVTRPTTSTSVRERSVEIEARLNCEDDGPSSSPTGLGYEGGSAQRPARGENVLLPWGLAKTSLNRAAVASGTAGAPVAVSVLGPGLAAVVPAARSRLATASCPPSPRRAARV